MIYIGIYKILNLIDGKFYIGSSVNMVKRWEDHQYLLSINNHRNKHLQNAWNKYNGENFEFSGIEAVKDVKKLIEREQHWIDITKCYERSIGYNLNKLASSVLGLKHTLESKLKNSNSHKGKKLKPHVIELLKLRNTGAKRSEEAKFRMSLAQRKNEALRRRDKWPHGYICQCDECRQKKKEYQKIWFRNKRSGIQIVNNIPMELFT